MPFKPSMPPSGTVSVLDHERRLLEMAELLEKKARALLDNDARIGAATGNQLALSAVKYRNAAAELASRREELDHRAELLAHHKLMLGIKGDRRLKRKGS